MKRKVLVLKKSRLSKTLKLSEKSKSASTLKLSKKSKPEKPVKAKKPAKPKKPKKNIPTEEPITSKADRAEKHFLEKYQVWGEYLPLSLGIADEIMSNYQKEYSIKSITLLMSRHVSNPEYLQNIIDMEERRNLQGEVTHSITEKQKAHAKRKLERLSQESSQELSQES